MLFDLRSRGRRRTVQGVYLGLALLMGGGLVLFGVGAGNGFGGLLNAFNGGGSGNSKPVVSRAERSALRQTQLHPNNPAAWAALVQARYEAAGQESSQTTGSYTAAGLKELRGAGQAWQRYLQLTKKPNWTLAELVANAYEQLGDSKSATSAWQIVTEANPTAYTYFEHLAVDAWSAKETDLGDLASQKAISLAPATLRLQVKATLQQLKARATSSGGSSSATGR
jgi:hypothetical protein